ncbi:MAG: hypothetical protein V3S69_06880 [Dehalococcoidales bacterium]
MATQLRLNVGRVRVTSAVSPSEASYIQSIRVQMKALEQNMHKVVNHINMVTPEALEFGLLPIFEESQRLVPVDTGRLRRSGFIETRRTTTGAVAAVGYGRFGSPHYAGFVHEMTGIPHAGETQAKFLEQAVKNKIDTFGRRVQLFIKRTMGDRSG